MTMLAWCKASWECSKQQIPLPQHIHLAFSQFQLAFSYLQLVSCSQLLGSLSWPEKMSCINCADSSPRFCNVCGREVGQLWSWARAGFYQTLCVCADQEVSARMVCKLRHTIGSCCSTRNLPPILQEILLRPGLAEWIARLLEFGPREIACAFRNMLQIPFVRMPLPSPVTDCILSFLRTDFT